MILLNNYKKAKRQTKLKRNKEFLDKLYLIENEVKKSLSENRTFIVLHESDCWTIAKNIFHNGNFNSRGAKNWSKKYHLNYFGLLKLKILIWIYEKRC